MLDVVVVVGIGVDVGVGVGGWSDVVVVVVGIAVVVVVVCGGGDFIGVGVCGDVGMPIGLPHFHIRSMPALIVCISVRVATRGPTAVGEPPYIPPWQKGSRSGTPIHSWTPGCKGRGAIGGMIADSSPRR